MANHVPDMQPMATAPRDGTVIRLWLVEDRSDLTGYYGDKWYGWVDRADPCALIRGDNCFLGWAPVDRLVWLNAPPVRRRRGPPK
jgi:hypothetical protein